VNLTARLFPAKHRPAYLAVCKAAADVTAARGRLAAAKTPKAQAAAEAAVTRASNRHHQAMGRLPLPLQALAVKSGGGI
jgi:hypothetical protein